MSTLRSFVLPDNPDLWSPEDRERPSCSALPDSIKAEMDAFHLEASRLREVEQDADDAARCEAAVITCAVGIDNEQFDALNTFVSLWVQSPKTGRTIRLGNGWWRDLPNDFAVRIQKALALGRATADFTVEELRALMDVEAKMVRATTEVLPAGPRYGPLNFGSRRRR